MAKLVEFRIRLATGELQTVQGQPFTVPTMPGYTFAVHPSVRDARYKGVSEIASGLSASGSLHSTNAKVIITDCIERFERISDRLRVEFCEQLDSLIIVDAESSMEQHLAECTKRRQLVEDYRAAQRQAVGLC